MSYSQFSDSRPSPASGRTPTPNGAAAASTSNLTGGASSPSRDRNRRPEVLILSPSQMHAKYQLNAEINENANSGLPPDLYQPQNLDVYVETVDRFGNNLGVTFKKYSSGAWDYDNDKALIDFQHGGQFLTGDQLLTDWIFTSRDGSPGILYIYVNDQIGKYSTWFTKKSEKAIQSVKSPPGFFQRGVGPLGWLLYQIGGWSEIDAFNRWESAFSESARMYITYSAPLSSDVFKIAEAINGHSVEGNKSFSKEERVEKFVSGIKGIVSLAGSSEIEFLCGFLDQFVDYLIEKIDDEGMRNEVKIIKEFLKEQFEGVEVDDLIEKLKNKTNSPQKKQNMNLQTVVPFG